MEHFVINDKLRLEKIKLSMADEIFKSIDRDREYLREWLPFVDFTTKVADTESFIEQMLLEDKNKKNTIYSLWYKEEFAGLIGFKDTDWVNRKTEFGYWLVKKMQGKGLITSSLKKLIPFTFQKLKLNRIQIKVAIGNAKSAAIPIHLGFKKEGIERAGEFHLNNYLDLEVFSLLREDWSGF